MEHITCEDVGEREKNSIIEGAHKKQSNAGYAVEFFQDVKITLGQIAHQ